MADSPLLRRLVESRGSVFAARFVAGSTLDDAIDTIRALNRRGIDVTLSHLGEHVHDPTAAWAEADIFCEALERIQKENVRCHLSVKPSQMALDVDKAVCESAIRKVVEKAAETGNRVRLVWRTPTPGRHSGHHAAHPPELPEYRSCDPSLPSSQSERYRRPQ